MFQQKHVAHHEKFLYKQENYYSNFLKIRENPQT